MKKLSALFIALQFISMDILADTDIVYQWQASEGTISQIGGSISYYGGDNGIKINVSDADNVTGLTYNTVVIDGQASHQNDTEKSTLTGHMYIDINNALEAGDILTITGYQNNSLENGASSLYIEIGSDVFSAGTETAGYWTNINKYVASNYATPSTYSWTITEQQAGKKHFTITLAEGEAPVYITDIKVAREYSSAEMQSIVTCKAGYINSICYPYTVTCEEGSAQFYYFDGIVNGCIYGTPVEDGTLLAGVPYLFIPASDQITITRKDATESSVSAKHYHGIYGNYTANRVLKGNQYKVLSTDGLVYCSSKGTKIRQYSCYFVDSEIRRTTTISSKTVCLSSFVGVDEEDETATSVDAITQAQSDNTPIYSISGQRVSSPRQGGVYIINGKKVIMK